MKKVFLLTTIVLVLGLPAFAQPGPRGGGQGPNLGGPISKLFAANQSFSAVMVFQGAGPDGRNVTMPGKIYFDNGKSRFEMNMSEIQGGQISPNAAEQMKAMGMDSMISISRPDLKLAYLVYPGLNSYAEVPSRDAAASATPNDYKAETEKLGNETVDGHDCVKNKVTVTDKEGNQHESTVWNATDLKDFPVKIVATEQGHTSTMQFKNISFDKPAASNFEPPAGFTKYDDVQTMMRTEMMKKMGGAMGMQPGHP